MADSGDSVTKAPQIGDENPEAVAGMRVLRLCSVFEPVALSGRSARYDAIGGMQNHTAELSGQLDRMGARQLILTSRLDGPAGRARFRRGRARFGRRGQVMRRGRYAAGSRRSGRSAGKVRIIQPNGPWRVPRARLVLPPRNAPAGYTRASLARSRSGSSGPAPGKRSPKVTRPTRASASEPDAGGVQKRRARCGGYRRWPARAGRR